jgi:hypothetical protein
VSFFLNIFFKNKSEDVQNIGLVLATLLTSKLPHYNLFFGFYQLLPKFMLNFYFLIFYFFFADHLATAFMILNRLTGILLALKHKLVGRGISKMPILSRSNQSYAISLPFFLNSVFLLFLIFGRIFFDLI